MGPLSGTRLRRLHLPAWDDAMQEPFPRWIPILAATALLLAAGLVRASESVADLDYASQVEFRSLSYQDGRIEIELLNLNAHMPTEEQARVNTTRWLAVPPDCEVTYKVEEVEWTVYWENGETEGPLGLEDESLAGPIPAALLRPSGSHLGTFRSVGLAQLTVPLTGAITRTTPVLRRGTAVIHRARIHANLFGSGVDRPIAPDELATRDPYLLEFSRHLVINPDMVQLFTRSIPQLPRIEEVREWSARLDHAHETGPVLLARITHPGLYEISPRLLRDWGFDPAAFRSDQIRLFAGQRELPAVVDSPSSGPFVGETRFLFYVPELPDTGAKYLPLWLMPLTREKHGDPPAMREIQDNDLAQEMTGEFELHSSVLLFEPREYNRRLPFIDRSGQWATRVVGLDRFERIPFDVDALLDDVPGLVSISYGGYFNNLRMYAQLYINGQRVGPEEQLTGNGPFVRTYSVPAGILRQGRNLITIHFPEVKDERIAGELAVAWAEVTYPVDAENFPVNRKVVLSGAEGEKARVAVPGARVRLPQNMYLLDVTDPYRPVRIRNRNLERRGDVMVNTFDIRAASGPIILYFSDDESVRYVGGFERMEKAELLEPEDGADLIVIAAPELYYALNEYVQLRRNEGVKVALVNSRDIMNVFNFGQKDYRPIQDFLRHAFRDWPGRRPRRVLLVGEASEFPWEHLHPRADVSPNMLPVYGFNDGSVRVQSDDSYALVAGRDALTDLEIGRFSARTVEEVRGLVRRTWQYESSPPAGPWLRRHAFITDDEAEFERVAERLIKTSLERNAIPERVYLQRNPYEDYFRIYQRKRSTATTEKIIDALSRGALTATYLGHGGPNLWSGERIFHYRDIDRLKADGRRPIMTAASCDTAWIDYPVDPVRQSIGEQFLLAENGGAIALFAPVSGTSSYEHEFLLRPFFQALNHKNFRTVGEISLYAKLQYMLERNQAYVANQFVLLGDPSLKVPRVSDRIGVQITPGDLFVDQRRPVALQGESPRIRWGMAEAGILTRDGQFVAGPVRAPIVGGSFRMELAMPMHVEEGDYRLAISASNPGQNLFDFVESGLPIARPRVDLQWRSDPPLDSPIQAGQPVRLTLRAMNESETYMDDLVLRIRNVNDNADLTSAPLVLQPGQALEWNFQIQIPPGITIIEASVDFREQRPHADPIVRREAQLRGQGSNAPAVGALAARATVERIATPESTVFTIPLYNLKPEPLTNVTADLALLDRPEGTPVGVTANVAMIDEFANRTLQFTARTQFPEGRLPFRLTVSGTSVATSETFSQVIQPLLIDIPKGTDLLVVPGSVRTERADYVKGHTVYVRATIQNAGQSPLVQVTSTLYVDHPWDANAIAPSITNEGSITLKEPLLPGERRELRFRYDPPEGSNLSYRLYVVVNSDRRVVESDFSNNVGDVGVNMLRLPNLALDRQRLRASTEYVRPGEVVSLTIPYKNDSPFDFAYPFIVEVRASGPGADSIVVYRGTIDRLNAGESGAIQTSWQADGRRDTISVSLNDDRDYGEQDVADNTATLKFIYILGHQFVEASPDLWSFSPTFMYGSRESLYVAPDESLVLARFPTRLKRLPFSNEHVVGSPLPEEARGTESDNLMAIVGGGLFWTPFETPPPVTFRIPMPEDDETTLYDVYITQRSPESPDGMPANQYRFLIEDETTWQRSNPKERNPYVGRIETRDNFLDITFAPDATPSWNNINSIDVTPIQGTFVSALYQMHSLQEGVLEVEADEPEGTRIVYDMRTGTGSRDELRFGDWKRVEPGDVIAADSSARFLQWRARLLGGADSQPVLRDLRVRFGGNQAVAEAAHE